MTRKEIIQGIQEELANRLSESSQAIERLKDSVRTETKSSMGDKFETGREMMKSELSKLEESHSRLLQYQHTLNQIGDQTVQPVGTGSLVQYGEQFVLIGPALGQVKLGKTRIMCISPASPIAQKLMGKNSGDSLQVNSNTFNIRIL